MPADGVVQFWQGRPGFRDGVLLGEVPFTVGINQKVTVPFEFLRREGKPELFARLAKLEQNDSTADNTAGVSLYFERVIDNHMGSLPSSVSWADTVLSARLTGASTPELLVAVRDRDNPSQIGVVVEALQRQPSGSYSTLWKFVRASAVHHAVATSTLSPGSA